MSTPLDPYKTQADEQPDSTPKAATPTAPPEPDVDAKHHRENLKAGALVVAGVVAVAATALATSAHGAEPPPTTENPVGIHPAVPDAPFNAGLPDLVTPIPDFVGQHTLASHTPDPPVHQPAHLAPHPIATAQQTGALPHEADSGSAVLHVPIVAEVAPTPADGSLLYNGLGPLYPRLDGHSAGVHPSENSPVMSPPPAEPVLPSPPTGPVNQPMQPVVESGTHTTTAIPGGVTNAVHTTDTPTPPVLDTPVTETHPIAPETAPYHFGEVAGDILSGMMAPLSGTPLGALAQGIGSLLGSIFKPHNHERIPTPVYQAEIPTTQPVEPPVVTPVDQPTNHSTEHLGDPVVESPIITPIAQPTDPARDHPTITPIDTLTDHGVSQPVITPVDHTPDVSHDTVAHPVVVDITTAHGADSVQADDHTLGLADHGTPFMDHTDLAVDSHSTDPGYDHAADTHLSADDVHQ